MLYNSNMYIMRLAVLHDGFRSPRHIQIPKRIISLWCMFVRLCCIFNIYIEIYKTTSTGKINVCVCFVVTSRWIFLELQMVILLLLSYVRSQPRQSNPIQCVQTGAGSPLCPHLAYIRSHTNWYTSSSN